MIPLEKLAWLTDTALGQWVISSGTIWPTLECIHFISLCILAGGLLVIDLRLTGFWRDRFVPETFKLTRIVLVAFLVNLVTGICFFAGNAPKYIDNPAFELKLVLILLAGLNALVYRFVLSPVLASEEVTTASKCVGYASLLLWAGVIVCGRMITFFAT